MAYWTKCAPCHLHYDVIGKVETSTEDAKYIANKTGMPNALFTNRRMQTREWSKRWLWQHLIVTIILIVICIDSVNFPSDLRTLVKCTCCILLQLWRINGGSCFALLLHTEQKRGGKALWLLQVWLWCIRVWPQRVPRRSKIDHQWNGRQKWARIREK